MSDLLITPISHVIPAMPVVESALNSANKFAQAETPKEVPRVVVAEPAIASPSSSTSSQFKQQNESSNSSQQHQNNSSSGSAKSLVESIEVQRAAAKLMQKANELERLAQELRSESHSSSNNTSAVKTQLALSDASKSLTKS